jgi:CYTH domain-containing protein
MPVENERKYVLPPDFDAESLKGWECVEVRQAYLDDGPRIRHFGGEHIFTYKKWVPQAKELVEIETALSPEDFDLLWPLCEERVRKTRYIRHTPDGEWVVDFLRTAKGSVYFVMAEVEMPRHRREPAAIPAEIATAIVHAVEPGDNRFTNKKLSDRDYAEDLLDKVTK